MLNLKRFVDSTVTGVGPPCFGGLTCHFRNQKKQKKTTTLHHAAPQPSGPIGKKENLIFQKKKNNFPVKSWGCFPGFPSGDSGNARLVSKTQYPGFREPVFSFSVKIKIKLNPNCTTLQRNPEVPPGEHRSCWAPIQSGEFGRNLIFILKGM